MTHPAPLVPCRDAEAGEIPKTAARLARDAETAGWSSRVTYAHGTNIGAQGQPTSLVESVVVRLRRGPLMAVGVWHDGKFHVAFIGSPWTQPRQIGARDLARFVKEPAA